MDYLEKLSAKNLCVAVTGGGGLLGHAIVDALLQAEAKVVCIDLEHSRCKHLNASHETLNLSSSDELEAVFKKLTSKYPEGFDTWINSAYPRSSDWGTPEGNSSSTSWLKNIDLQLNSYCILSHLACEHMRAKNKKGSVINIGSIYGVVANDPTLYENTSICPPSAYPAIKGGILNYSRYLASIYGSHGIRVNVLSPGGVENKQDSKFIERYSTRTPLKRMGKPDDIASAALFLATNASSYITGANLLVDGGYTAI